MLLVNYIREKPTHYNTSREGKYKYKKYETEKQYITQWHYRVAPPIIFFFLFRLSCLIVYFFTHIFFKQSITFIGQVFFFSKILSWDYCLGDTLTQDQFGIWILCYNIHKLVANVFYFGRVTISNRKEKAQIFKYYLKNYISLLNLLLVRQPTSISTP